jgi:hypothetical protein
MRIGNFASGVIKVKNAVNDRTGIALKIFYHIADGVACRVKKTFNMGAKLV